LCHQFNSGSGHFHFLFISYSAGDPDQAYAKELAEQGFITFAPDAIAFEERNWSKIPGHAEYFELSSRLVQGKALMAKVLHAVGLDYLMYRHHFFGHKFEINNFLSRFCSRSLRELHKGSLGTSSQAL
jgi:hypothetical protein